MTGRKYRVYLPIRKISQAYLEGATVTELANKYYVSYYCMWMRLKDRGVLREKPNIELTNTELKERYTYDNMSVNDIAKMYHKTPRKLLSRIHSNHYSHYTIRPNANPTITEITKKAVIFLVFDGRLTREQIAQRCNITRKTVYNYLKELKKDE